MYFLQFSNVFLPLFKFISSTFQMHFFHFSNVFLPLFKCISFKGFFSEDDLLMIKMIQIRLVHTKYIFLNLFPQPSMSTRSILQLWGLTSSKYQIPFSLSRALLRILQWSQGASSHSGGGF